MKLSILRSVVIAFIPLALLSSCSVMQKGEFAQRKYYNFPRANHSVDEKQDRLANVDPVSTPPAEQVSAEARTVESQVIAPSFASVETTPDLSVKSPAVKASSTLISFRKTEVEKSNVPETSAREFYSKTRSLPGLLATAPSMFIQIIAAIFLPPIGIFMHDNNRTGAWFWVALIFCIAAVACFAVADPAILTTVGALLWLAAAITAVLVVLDVFQG